MFKISNRAGENIWGYLFILPSGVALSIFYLFSIGFSFYVSLYDWMIKRGSFIGIGNYMIALTSPDFWNAVKNTVLFTFLTVGMQLILGLITALLLNRSLRGKTLFRAVFFLPCIIPSVILGIIWRWMYSPQYGLVNFFLQLLRLNPLGWLRDPTWALPALIFMSVWQWIGYHMIIYLAGLQGIPEQLYEAAKIDGATVWSCFRHITWPLLRPATMFLVIVSIINTFQIFDQVYVMTGGGPMGNTSVLVYYLWKEAFHFFKLGYASAVAWLVFLMIFAFTLFQLKFAKVAWW